MEAAAEPLSSTEKPLDWLRQIPGDLFQLDETPLLGAPSPFPWSEFTKQIEHALQIEKLKLTPSEWQWRPKEELLAGLGGELQTTALSLAPLAGLVYWSLPRPEILSLMKHIFAKGKTDISLNLDPDFYEAFDRFLSSELIAAFEKADFDKQLSLTLVPDAPLPSEHCLCLDVEIGLQQGSPLHGRVLLTPEFRKSWTQRYQKQQARAMLTSPLADKLSVIVHLEAGKTTLAASEWKNIQIGDLLLLDTCSLDPDEDKGRVMLVINNVPFFRGRIKQGSIKILEHPLYHEVDTNMTNPQDKSEEDKKEENEDSFESSDFEDELSEELTDAGETTGADSQLEDEEFDIESEEIDVEESPGDKTKEPAPAPQAEAKTSAVKAPAPRAAALPVEAPPEQKPMSIEDVPLNIVVEAGRIQMSIKKILELQPGNMLDLNIHPEAGVDLVINGRRIAKGELLRIGDAIGVRIIELS